MKVIMQQITEGEEAVIIRYREGGPELEAVLRALSEQEPLLLGRNGEERRRLAAWEIYYFESVDERLFAYTESGEYQVQMTLSQAEERFVREGFFRCNKSFVINRNKIRSLRSEMGSRIDAELENGEHVIISRRYAKAFRAWLKGGETDGER